MLEIILLELAMFEIELEHLGKIKLPTLLRMLIYFDWNVFKAFWKELLKTISSCYNFWFYHRAITMNFLNIQYVSDICEQISKKFKGQKFNIKHSLSFIIKNLFNINKIQKIVSFLWLTYYHNSLWNPNLKKN